MVPHGAGCLAQSFQILRGIFAFFLFQSKAPADIQNGACDGRMENAPT